MKLSKAQRALFFIENQSANAMDTSVFLVDRAKLLLFLSTLNEGMMIIIYGGGLRIRRKSLWVNSVHEEAQQFMLP